MSNPNPLKKKINKKHRRVGEFYSSPHLPPKKSFPVLTTLVRGFKKKKVAVCKATLAHGVCTGRLLLLYDLDFLASLCMNSALSDRGWKIKQQTDEMAAPHQQQKKPIDNEAITSINPQQTSWLCSTTVILPPPIVPRHRAGASENREVQFYGTWARRQPRARLACTRVWWARP